MTSSTDPANPGNPDSSSNGIAQWISWLSVAAILAVAAWGWVQIPGDQNIAVHFDIFGKPDGYAAKPQALLMLPAVMAFACAFFWYRMKNEKFKENLEKSKLTTYIALFGSMVVIFEAQLVIVLAALGHQIPITTVMFVSIGLLLGAIGIAMAAGKTARNTCVGVRTPWALKDDRNWDKTNKMGGALMAATGILTACGALVNTFVAVAILVLGSLVMTSATFYCSYMWSRQPEKS
jgi:uncharacterized membrane protein